MDMEKRLRECKPATKDYVRALLELPELTSSHGRGEYRAMAAKERERYNLVTRIRDEFIDLIEDEGDDAEALLDAGDQILGGLQRELRRLQEQRKNVRNIRLEFRRWVQSVVDMMDAPEPGLSDEG